VTLGACPKASAESSTLNPGQIEEMVAAIGLPNPETEWRRPITKYLQLGIILDDEVGT
jgi:hypothetical protein